MCNVQCAQQYIIYKTDELVKIVREQMNKMQKTMNTKIVINRRKKKKKKINVESVRGKIWKRNCLVTHKYVYV